MFLAVWENPYVTIFILRVKTCVKSSYYNVELLQKDQIQSLFEIFEIGLLFHYAFYSMHCIIYNVLYAL